MVIVKPPRVPPPGGALGLISSLGRQVSGIPSMVTRMPRDEERGMQRLSGHNVHRPVLFENLLRRPYDCTDYIQNKFGHCKVASTSNVPWFSIRFPRGERSYSVDSWQDDLLSFIHKVVLLSKTLFSTEYPPYLTILLSSLSDQFDRIA